MWKEKIQNFRQAADFMAQVSASGMVPGLDSIRRLTAQMGNPQDSLQAVHIAGTNGKGSVLGFVSTILKCAGYRTGRYSSPAVFSDLEKIQVNGRSISRADYVRGLEAVRTAAEAMAAAGLPYPTVFEVETALAFWYFRERQCDIIVLETGLGGLQDATNVIKNTIAAVITSVSRDHTAILGDSLAEIAAQEAGIIKNGCYVVSAGQDRGVMAVVEGVCSEKEAALRIADVSRAERIRSGLTRQRFDYAGMRKLEIALAGRYQIENAVVAVEVIDALRRCGYPVTEKMLRRGLLETKWPGRFTILAKRPIFVMDGAHNAEGAEKLRESVRFFFTNKRIVAIIGVLKDKDYEKIAELTAPLASQMITVTPPGTGRALPAYVLAEAVRCYNPNVTAADSLEEAVEMSYLLADSDSVILAYGSLSYLGKLAEIVADRDRIRRDAHGRSGED